MSHTSQAAQAVTLHAADGYPISAYLYATSAEIVKGQLLIAGATAVGQQFYRRFAEYACTQGFNVLTLDYRGTGQSAPKQLKGFQMAFEDWGQLDLAAAVDFMQRDDLPLFLVGHSYGGHALGLLPNHQKISRCYTVGTGAGWHGWMPLAERLKRAVYVECYIPCFCRLERLLALENAWDGRRFAVECLPPMEALVWHAALFL